MYEIWLALNIVWEILVAQKSWIVPLGIVFAVLVALAWVRAGDWRFGWFWARSAGVIAFAAAVIALPSLSAAAWSDLTYVVDWLLLVALAVTAAVVVAVLVWPLAAALRPRVRSRTPDPVGAGG